MSKQELSNLITKCLYGVLNSVLNIADMGIDKQTCFISITQYGKYKYIILAGQKEDIHMYDNNLTILKSIKIRGGSLENKNKNIKNARAHKSQLPQKTSSSKIHPTHRNVMGRGKAKLGPNPHPEACK